MTISRYSRSARKRKILVRLIAAQGGKCAICGRELPPLRYSEDAPHRNQRRDPTIDHIVPLCCGGPNLQSNMQAVCRECNNNKGGFNPQWLGVPMPSAGA